MSNAEDPKDDAPLGEPSLDADQLDADQLETDQHDADQVETDHYDAESHALHESETEESIVTDSEPTEDEAAPSSEIASQADEELADASPSQAIVDNNDEGNNDAIDETTVEIEDQLSDASEATSSDAVELNNETEGSDQSYLDTPYPHDGTATAETIEWDDSALDGPMPNGMCRNLSGARVILDTLSGRSSVFGYGYAPLIEAIGLASQGDMGDSAALIDLEHDLDRTLSDDSENGDSYASRLQEQVEQFYSEDPAVAIDTILLRPSADAAVESAIALARRCQPGKAFRTIAMVGSDHGRTGMCRSASGQPELHDGFGPMMAGFSHVPVGDIDALRNAIDDQTACVLISPIDLGHAAMACDGEFMAAVRDTCDEHNLLLVVDETQLVIGAAGQSFTFRAIADIHADIAVLSAGLFAGLPGGLVLASAKGSIAPVRDLDRFPIHAAVASETLSEMLKLGLPHLADDATESLAVSIAKSIGGFEFIRDLHATGQTIGLETDLDSRDVVRAARRNGLHVARAGSTGICLQPPLVIAERERQVLSERLRMMMESLEREASVLAI